MGGEWEVTREQNGNWQGAGLQLAVRLLSGRHALLGWSLLPAPFLQIYVVSPVVVTEECPRYQREAETNQGGDYPLFVKGYGQ